MAIQLTYKTQTTAVCRGKAVPVLLLLPQTPYKLACDQTPASVLTAQSVTHLSHIMTSLEHRDHSRSQCL